MTAMNADGELKLGSLIYKNELLELIEVVGGPAARGKEEEAGCEG